MTGRALRLVTAQALNPISVPTCIFLLPGRAIILHFPSQTPLDYLRVSRSLQLSADYTACSVISTLVPMQNVEGGFGGGHGQLSHCASSYAAVLSLVMIGGEEALNVIDRKMLSVRASQPYTRHR